MRKSIVPLTAAGAAVLFFFDPASGRARRARVGQRVPAFLRRRRDEAGRVAGRAGASASAVTQKATHLREEPKVGLNDQTIEAKLRSELFRDPELPKGRINVNVQDGVVQLRGEVPRPELIEELVDRARAVQGVRDVESLLHLPGAEAPMHN